MKLNADFNGILIEDELHANVGPSEFTLNHDTIMDDGFTIYTGQNKTGEELVLGTDYELLDEDTRLSAQTDGIRVYTKVRILNEDYHGTNLYVTYKTVGDYAVAEDINAAVEKVLTPQAKADLTNPEMVPTWPFVLNHTKNHVIEFPSEEGCAVCCDDKYVYVGVQPSSIIKIDAYTKEQVLRVDTDQFPTHAYDTYMFISGNHLFVNNYSEKIVKYETETLTEVGRYPYYSMAGFTVDYDYVYRLQFTINGLAITIIDPATMEEIQSIDLSGKVEVSDYTPLIICGKDRLVFGGAAPSSWSPRLIWVSRTNPGSIIVSNFADVYPADVYPTGTIFTQDDSFFSISYSPTNQTHTIVRVTPDEKTEMLTFSSNGFSNPLATTDGKYVYFVGRRIDPPALRVVKYDPIANKATKKTVQGYLNPKAVTSNGRQLIILCNDEDSGQTKLLFLNTRMEEGVE